MGYTLEIPPHAEGSRRPGTRSGTPQSAVRHTPCGVFQPPATGLYYYGYRYYDPVTGRWPSRDPIFEISNRLPELLPEGPSLYSFGYNDPNNGYDVHGMFWKGILDWWIKKQISIGKKQGKKGRAPGTLGGPYIDPHWVLADSTMGDQCCWCHLETKQYVAFAAWTWTCTYEMTLGGYQDEETSIRTDPSSRVTITIECAKGCPASPVGGKSFLAQQMDEVFKRVPCDEVPY